MCAVRPHLWGAEAEAETGAFCSSTAQAENNFSPAQPGGRRMEFSLTALARCWSKGLFGNRRRLILFICDVKLSTSMKRRRQLLRCSF
jgi:hypothetical protein